MSRDGQPFPSKAKARVTAVWPELPHCVAAWGIPLPVSLEAGWTCRSTAGYLRPGILTGRWAYVSGTELRLLEEGNGARVTEDPMDLRRASAARLRRDPQG